jgi:hypothetical protein
MKKTLLVSALVFVLLVTSFMTISCKALGIGTAGTVQSVVIPATGTAYVVTDASTSDDPQGLRDQNFSTQDFIKIWYAWDVQATEKVISIGLFNFDLSSVKNKDIKSATLQMYATRTDLTKAVRLVDVSLVDGTWDSKTVTYNTRPTWGGSAIATCAVYGAGVWYSWDVSASVAQKAKDGDISYVSGLNTMDDKSEEQVLFASKQVSATAPRLLVTYTSSTTSLVPWYIWVAGIVIIAIIAFFVGWSVTRRRQQIIQQQVIIGGQPPEQKK